MKGDTIMLELWQSKDARSRRFGGDVRALCRHLMDNQESRQGSFPLVKNLEGSLKAHEIRISNLPLPVPGSVLLPDDPVMAELREIRSALHVKRMHHQSAVGEVPPEYGDKQD